MRLDLGHSRIQGLQQSHWTSLSRHRMSIFHSSSFIFRQTPPEVWPQRWPLAAPGFCYGSRHPQRGTFLQLFQQLSEPAFTGLKWNWRLCLNHSVILIGQARLRGRIRNGIRLCKLRRGERESLFLQKRSGGLYQKKEEWMLCITSKSAYYIPSTVTVYLLFKFGFKCHFSSIKSFWALLNIGKINQCLNSLLTFIYTYIITSFGLNYNQSFCLSVFSRLFKGGGYFIFVWLLFIHLVNKYYIEWLLFEVCLEKV